MYTINTLLRKLDLETDFWLNYLYKIVPSLNICLCFTQSLNNGLHYNFDTQIN